MNNIMRIILFLLTLFGTACATTRLSRELVPAHDINVPVVCPAEGPCLVEANTGHTELW